MKYNFFLSIVVLFTTISSCTVGNKSSKIQLESNSYLMFVSQSFDAQNSDWSVKIDEGAITPIKINKANKSFSNDYKYEIPNGTHNIKVFKNNNLYLEKKIFIGNRETKKIKV